MKPVSVPVPTGWKKIINPYGILPDVRHFSYLRFERFDVFTDVTRSANLRRAIEETGGLLAMSPVELHTLYVRSI